MNTFEILCSMLCIIFAAGVSNISQRGTGTESFTQKAQAHGTHSLLGFLRV